MTAAVDGELVPRQREALDRHVAGCEACRHDLAAIERVLAVVATVPTEAPVSARLEQDTLRRVRLAAAEETERPGWRRWLPLPAFAVATAAVVVLAFGIVLRTGDVAQAPAKTAAPAPPGEARVARAPVAKPAVPVPAAPPAVTPPGEPPAELAAAPDKFMNLPILRNLEKLEHFDAIQTTTLDDEPLTPGGEEQPSNG